MIASVLSIAVGVGIVILLVLAVAMLVVAVSLVVGGSLHRSVVAAKDAWTRRRGA